MIPIIAAIVVLWSAWSFFEQRRQIYCELKRFKSDPQDLRGTLEGMLERLFTQIGLKVQRSQSRSQKKSLIEREMSRKVKQAGLESASDIGKFALLRFASCIGIPAIAAISYLFMTRYYATVTLIFATGVAVIIPQLWLKSKIARRTEDIQRELPLLIDLTNLGTSAGWDVTTALEKVVDALSVEFPHHPLMKEYRKARWLASTGYTWAETLERLNGRLANDAVRRCNLALVQAMKQGGDRTQQLEGIAADAERTYYSELDKRLAALPVKVVLVTIFLVIAYLMVLMAPAAVQIKNVMSKRTNGIHQQSK